MLESVEINRVREGWGGLAQQGVCTGGQREGEAQSDSLGMVGVWSFNSSSCTWRALTHLNLLPGAFGVATEMNQGATGAVPKIGSPPTTFHSSTPVLLPSYPLPHHSFNFGSRFCSNMRRWASHLQPTKSTASFTFQESPTPNVCTPSLHQLPLRETHLEKRKDLVLVAVNRLVCQIFMQGSGSGASSFFMGRRLCHESVSSQWELSECDVKSSPKLHRFVYPFSISYTLFNSSSSSTFQLAFPNWANRWPPTAKACGRVERHRLAETSKVESQSFPGCSVFKLASHVKSVFPEDLTGEKHDFSSACLFMLEEEKAPLPNHWHCYSEPLPRTKEIQSLTLKIHFSCLKSDWCRL